MHDVVSSLRFEPVCTAMLREGRTIRFQAPGTSMLPTIHDGDTLIVEAVDVRQVRRGDVVLVAGPSFIHAHRVRRVPAAGEDFLILRGDALAANDCPIPRRNVLGRVVRVRHNGKYHRVSGMVIACKRPVFRLGRSCRRVIARGIRAVYRLALVMRLSPSSRVSQGRRPGGGQTKPPLRGAGQVLEV